MRAHRSLLRIALGLSHTPRSHPRRPQSPVGTSVPDGHFPSVAESAVRIPRDPEPVILGPRPHRPGRVP